MRKVYLDETPLDEAVDSFFRELDARGALKLTPAGSVPVESSLGRVTAERVVARISSPHYHAAAMDGIAVRSASTFGAGEAGPVRLRTGDEAVFVDTGDPIPDGFDAVIMVEDLVEVKADSVLIIAPATPWQHVRTIGEDLVATETILPYGHTIRPVDVGAMLAGGVAGVLVRRRPSVAIIPTGNELIEPGEPLAKGKIIDFNSRVISGLVDEWGGSGNRKPIVRDDLEALRAALNQAATEADIIVVNAGSSAGREDFTRAAVEAEGSVFVHGVAIKPGKPVILGVVREKAVIGIPGYPVSCVLTCELFVKPLIERMLGIIRPSGDIVKATMARKVYSSPGVEEFLRVKVGKVGEKMVATPISRGAGLIMSLVRADGIVRVPRMSQGLEEGEEVAVELLRTRDEIENTIVVIGSHDLALDVLGTHLGRRYPGMTLSSAHAGSLAGLTAMRRGEAHLAGIHLLDEETGEYNVPYVRRFLPGGEHILVTLVYRDQGLMVPEGNPKGIRGIGDLTRPDVSFVNRQRGAGTRILLDLKLKEMGIERSAIKGYEREEYTHMAVAASVAAGVSDTGLGILAAARALGLDFIPVARERYDLVIPRKFVDSEMIRRVLAVLNEADFRKEVESLGGYEVSDTGKMVME